MRGDAATADPTQSKIAFVINIQRNVHALNVALDVHAVNGLNPAETEGPLATWREWASDVHGFSIDCGHYLAEEAPEATAKALIDFFTAA